MSDDPLWQELEDSADRDRPRYDPARWGTCSICRRGPTDIITFSGVQWCLCDLCSQRWPAGAGLLRPSPDDPDDPELSHELEEAVTFEAIHSLAVDYIDRLPGIPPGLPVTVTIRQEDSFMPRPTAPKFFDIDPHHFLTPRETKPLGILNKTDRILVTSAILKFYEENPGAGIERHPIHRGFYNGWCVNPARCWDAIRDQIADTETGRTFEAVLSGGDLVGAPYAIQQVVLLFLRLRDRRAELEEQLRALDSIATAFALPEEQVSA